MTRVRAFGRFGPGDALAMAAGLAFLYLPIVLVVAYSFNASRLVTVWGGFSTRWYVALLADAPLLDAAWSSLKVAVASGALATVVGTLAALVLARHGRFHGRHGFTALLLTPMVMPDVIIGLSLLLLFVSLGWERDLWAVTIAHATLSTSFVAIVVQARWVTLDIDLERAAADLGAGPIAVFATVTLPLLAPAILSGFLLAFTISLDDLVLASFMGGPGATTLPMRLYSQARLGVTPEINAVSTLVFAGVALLIMLAGAVFRLDLRRRSGPS